MRHATPEASVPISRVDTDLVFTDGTRVTLTTQRPLIRAIVHKAFDELRVSLLVHDAFPTPAVAFNFAREALCIAADQFEAGGGIVRRRLEVDMEYALKLSTLVRRLIT